MQATGEQWRLGHRPALDGLRGVAILLVVASHMFPAELVAAGPVGVTLFFTLSGFLITTLLLEEHARTGTISLRGFYARRARRLLPALFAMLAALLVVGVVTWRAALAVVLYVGDFMQMTGAAVDAPLRHMWSLAVEEQFYLVLPVFLVLLAARRRLLRGLLVAVLLAAMVERVALWPDFGWTRVYYAPDTNAAALVAGCLLALAAARRPSWRARPRLALVPLVACAPLCLAGEGYGAGVVAPLLVPFLAVAMIALLAGHGTVGWAELPWLCWLGRRSYGLYLWHYPIFIGVLPMLSIPFWAKGPVVVAAAVGTAVLSWRFIEQPFLRARPARCGSGAGHRAMTGVAAARPN